MVQTSSDRRLAENEVVFRGYNERMQARIDRARRNAHSSGGMRVPSASLEIHFYCECSDENCRKHIVLPVDDYRSIHTKRDHFIVLPGHEVLRVERIVSKTPSYYIVKKHQVPDESVHKLRKTEARNV